VHANKEDAPRITNQFHSKGGMAYDFRYRGARLSLLVTPRTRMEDAGEWRVEARAPAEGGGEPLIVTEWGSTRRGALDAVARAWGDAAVSGRSRGAFDWVAIAAALDTVRAL
jgi:hypothetical protein